MSAIKNYQKFHPEIKQRRLGLYQCNTQLIQSFASSAAPGKVSDPDSCGAGDTPDTCAHAYINKSRHILILSNRQALPTAAQTGLRSGYEKNDLSYLFSAAATHIPHVHVNTGQIRHVRTKRNAVPLMRASRYQDLIAFPALFLPAVIREHVYLIPLRDLQSCRRTPWTKAQSTLQI